MRYFPIALAIFSMFFGAGNVVFPLLLGTLSGDQNIYATAGLLLTSIGGPLIGLFGSILFEGHFRAFYERAGKWLGYFFIIVTTALLGPFAVMPRCFIVAYAAIQPFFPSLSLPLFSLIGGILVLALTMKRHQVINLLGYILSPLLLVALFIIIIKGCFFSGTVTHIEQPLVTSLMSGLSTGYDTMDLIAATYFSVSIWDMLKVKVHPSHVVSTTLISGTIAGLLLGIVYVGLSHTASLHIQELSSHPPETLLVTLSYLMLGPYLGAIASLAVILACLTTVIGLALTFADILRKDFISPKLSHGATLFILIALTSLFSNLGFTQIMKIIHPAVSLCYPSIIMLTLCNIGYKRWGWTAVKLPVWIVLLLTVTLSLIN
ncbi:MAG: branched-chain amino acid transport system II carrier protein [Simkaniaceae bacterium]|nr:branched-chain amino acid transport system II carrier protein [Simkaniaceae bacterium]